MKINKNDLCPCGSGLNYRYCCYGDKEPQEIFWRKENIEQYDSDKIIGFLKEMGVEITEENFENEAQDYESPQDLADYWYNNYDLNLKGNLEEIPEYAAKVLWERIIEDKKSGEILTDKIEEIQRLEENQKYVEVCDIGLEVWEELKLHLESDGYKDIRTIDRAFRTDNTFFNWCQKLELNLFKAGKDDPEYFQKCIQYCQEFVELLPKSPQDIIRNMKRAEAESYYKIDQINHGDQKFQQLVNEYPRWVWSYLSWGDMYALELEQPIIAKKIYEQALKVKLNNGKESREKVKERLSIFEDEELTDEFNKE